MHNYIKIILFSAVMLIGSWASAEEIRVDGGGAATSAIFLSIKESFEKATGDRLVVTSSTPVKGLIALEKGLADIATAAVPLQDMIKGAAKEGVTIDPSTLESIVMGKNRTVVFLHSYNEVKKLSKKQLKDIFTGMITNWRELGGDDGEIVVVWGKGTPGQNALFTHMIMDGEPVTSKAFPATDYFNIRDIIDKTPGAIGIGPHGLISALVRVPETPLLESEFIVITKGKPSAKVKKLLDYYKDEFGFLNH